MTRLTSKLINEHWIISRPLNRNEEDYFLEIDITIYLLSILDFIKMLRRREKGKRCLKISRTKHVLWLGVSHPVSSIPFSIIIRDLIRFQSTPAITLALVCILDILRLVIHR